MADKQEIICGGCGRKTAADNIRNIQIQTCCSRQNIPLCPECRIKHKKYAIKKLKTMVI